MRWSLIIITAATLGVGAFLIRSAWTPSTVISEGQRDSDSGPPRIFAAGVVEGARRELSLRFEMAGRLKAIYVREGDHVRAGDVLAELETQIAELRFAEARDRLRLALAERDRLLPMGRTDRPSSTGTNLPAELPAGDTRGAVPVSRPAAPDRLAWRTTSVDERDLAAAEGQVALAQTVVQREGQLLDMMQLRAPIDGLVVAVLPQPGELVGPADERDVVTLVDRSRTRVRAYVEELDVMRVTVGLQAAVTAVGAPDHPFSGVVAYCVPRVRPKSMRHQQPGEWLDVRVREVLIDLDDGTDLLLGLPVEVFIDPSLPAP